MYVCTCIHIYWHLHNTFIDYSKSLSNTNAYLPITYVSYKVTLSSHLFRLGASIVSEITNALPLFQKSYLNPLCFLQYYNNTIPFSEIDRDKVSRHVTCVNTTTSHVHRYPWHLLIIMPSLDQQYLLTNWISVHGSHILIHSSTLMLVIYFGHHL